MSKMRLYVNVFYFERDYVKDAIVCQCPAPYSMLYGAGH